MEIHTNMPVLSSRKSHQPLMKINQVCAPWFLFFDGMDVFHSSLVLLLYSQTLFYSSQVHMSTLLLNCRFPLRGPHTTAYDFNFWQWLWNFKMSVLDSVMDSVCKNPVNLVKSVKVYLLKSVHNPIIEVIYFSEFDKVMVFDALLVSIQIVLLVNDQHCNVRMPQL